MIKHFHNILLNNCFVLVMFAARAISQVAKVGTRTHVNFTGSVVSGPPRVRVSFAEKMVLASIMTSSFLAYPTWVMVHLQDYKEHK